MAYGKKYKAEYSNKQGDNIRIDILRKDYAGTVANIDKIKATASLKYKARDNEAVVGSELSFSFLTKNRESFDDLFTSNYKDFKAEFYINGLREWTGWLVIDNISTSYFDYVYTIDLSFNDGLAELDKFGVSNQAYNTIGNEQTLLFYIKNSIKYNDIPLNFSVILNTRETSLMPSLSDNTLLVATLHADRFYDGKNGIKEPAKCKDVINQILTPLNCKLFQAKNRYWIANNLEIDSLVYDYTWVDYTPQYYGVLNRTIDITGWNFEKGNELTKKRPLKSVDVVYKNKYIPTSIVPNSNFDTTDLSFWNLIPVQSGSISVINNAMHVIASGNGSTSVDGNILETDAMFIEPITTEDKIKFSFNVWLKTINFPPSNDFEITPNLEITLLKPDGTLEHKTWPAISGTTRKEFEFATAGPGNYFFKIKDYKSIIPNPPDGLTTDYTYLEYVVDGVLVTPVGSDGDVNTIITYDRMFSTEIVDSTAIDRDSIETVVGDGVMAFDAGNLKINGQLTNGWNTHNRNENLNLQYIYGINHLRLNQKFRNKLRLKLIASVADDVSFLNHFLFDGKRYLATDFGIDYGVQFTGIDLTLIELPTEDINFTTGTVTLNSVNGEEKESVVASNSGGIGTLQQTTEKGNTTNRGIVLQSPDGTKTVTISIGNDGHITFAGAAGQNFKFSGDVIAFS